MDTQSTNLRAINTNFYIYLQKKLQYCNLKINYVYKTPTIQNIFTKNIIYILQFLCDIYLPLLN